MTDTIAENHSSSEGHQWADRSEPTLVFSSTVAFDALVSRIKQAKRSIFIECYIYRYDGLGKRILQHLVEASQRGVTVQLMLDGVGSSGLPREFFQTCTSENIKVRIYHPRPFFPWKFSLRSLFRRIRNLNFRNHRKVCLIDGHWGWIGSANISSDHLEASQGGEGWLDVVALIHDRRMVSLMERSFLDTWREKRSGADWFQQSFRLGLRVFQSKKQRRYLIRDLIRRIRESKNRIWVSNAYFVPHKIVLSELKQASVRGVDVKIVLPRYSDVFFMNWVARYFYRELKKSRVDIYEYEESFLHEKTILIDDWCTVGSSNMNSRSFFLDLEVDIALTGGQSVLEMVSHFEKLFQKSRLHCSWTESPFWIFEYIFARFFLLFRSIL